MKFKTVFNSQAIQFLQTLQLSSVVREKTSKLINIENPLKEPVEFKKSDIKVSTDLVSIIPDNFIIPPNIEMGIEVN